MAGGAPLQWRAPANDLILEPALPTAEQFHRDAAGVADADGAEFLSQDVGAMSRRGHELRVDRLRIAVAHRQVFAARPVVQAPVRGFVAIMGELVVGAQRLCARLGPGLQA